MHRDDRTITAAPTSVTAIAGPATDGPAATPVAVGSAGEFDEVFADRGPLHAAVHRFFDAGGTRAVVVAAREPQDLGPALAALDGSAEPFHLLCFAQPVDPATRRAASLLCRGRRALLVVDPDPAWRQPPQAIERFTAGMALENSALYFPAAAGGVAVGAAVAGTIARLDAERGIGAAPAGRHARLRGIDALDQYVDEREAERLNAIGVNVLRTFPGIDGPVIWGARTLANEGEWKYVNVRRTALFVETSIERGLQWAVFEPNDESLWAEVRSRAGDFLTRLWRDGTLTGARPDEAFFVTCDRSTMSQADIDAGRLVVLVGIAQVRPAEFVIVRFALRAEPPGPPGPPGPLRDDDP